MIYNWICSQYLRLTHFYLVFVKHALTLSLSSVALRRYPDEVKLN